MANPFPFVVGDILTAAEMNDIGVSTAFTPSYDSGYTRGNGTVSAAHVRVNKLVFINISEVLGSTSAVTGNFVLTLPIAPANAQSISRSTCDLLDTGVFRFYGAVIGNSATTVRVEVLTTAVPGVVTVLTSVPVSATFPMTWATGDIFRIGIVYEAA